MMPSDEYSKKGMEVKKEVLFCSMTSYLAEVHSGSDVVKIRAPWLFFSVPMTGTPRTSSFLSLNSKLIFPSLLKIENRTELTSEMSFSLLGEEFGFKVKYRLSEKNR